MSTSSMQQTYLPAPSGVSRPFKPWDKHARGRMAAVWRMQTALDVAIHKQRIEEQKEKQKQKQSHDEKSKSKEEKSNRTATTAAGVALKRSCAELGAPDASAQRRKHQ